MSKLRTASFLALATSLSLALATPAFAQDAPKTEEEKTLYFLGTHSARQLSQFQLTASELAMVQKGISDAIAGTALQLDPQTYGTRAQTLLADRQAAGAIAEKLASQAFIDAEAAKPGVQKLASGMLVEEIALGTGEKPTVSDEVIVHYHGTLRTGEVFDSSVARGEPFRTQLSRVVKCWQEGVATMRVGGKSRLVCPSSLAYGDSGPTPAIKGGAALVFEVELLEVVK